MSFSLNPFMPQIYVYSIFVLFFIIIIIIIIIIVIIIIIIYVSVFSMCTGLAEKRRRFTQGLSLVLYFYFRIFYFCVVEL